MSWNAPRPSVAADPAGSSPVPAREAVTRSDTRRLVHELLAAGRSRAEIARQLGVSKGTVSYHARRLGHAVARSCARRYDWSAVQAHHDASHGIRECMEEGVKEGRCEQCVAQWRGQPLTLALHHINGRPDDNRLENLQLLCPNCHSQTDNFAGRNRRVDRIGDGTRAA